MYKIFDNNQNMLYLLLSIDVSGGQEGFDSFILAQKYQAVQTKVPKIHLLRGCWNFGIDGELADGC